MMHWILFKVLVEWYLLIDEMQFSGVFSPLGIGVCDYVLLEVFSENDDTAGPDGHSWNNLWIWEYGMLPAGERQLRIFHYAGDMEKWNITQEKLRIPEQYLLWKIQCKCEQLRISHS